MCNNFECERCGNIDSIHATQTTGAGYLCHRCLHGEWHHQFPEERYDFDRHGPVLNKPSPIGHDDGFPSFS